MVNEGRIVEWEEGRLDYEENKEECGIWEEKKED